MKTDWNPKTKEFEATIIVTQEAAEFISGVLAAHQPTDGATKEWLTIAAWLQYLNAPETEGR